MITINPFLAELQSKTWNIEPRFGETFFQRVAGFVLDPAFSGRLNKNGLNEIDNRDGEKTAITRRGSTAVIPISGVLMKKVPCWFDYYGIEATAYQQIIDNLNEALGDETVESIELLTSSPGGEVDGEKEAVDAVFNARSQKPVHAVIQDLGASAAAWITSQATTITATSPTTRYGSIGTFTVLVDSSKAAQDRGLKFNLVTSGPHKATGQPGVEITDEQLKPIQKIIDGITDLFIADEARGRGMKTAAVRKLATGRTWLAADAVANGLIDGIENTNGQVAGDSPRPKTLFEEKPMTEQTITAADIEAAQQNATKQARTEDANRLAELQAAFPDDPKRVMDNFSAGNTADQARLDHYGQIVTELAQAKTEIADLTVKLQAATNINETNAATGAQPIKADETGGTAGGDYMVMVKAHMKQTGCGKIEAMKRVDKDNPGLREKWNKDQADKKHK